jgi:phosphate transport system substrate-binding protein
MVMLAALIIMQGCGSSADKSTKNNELSGRISVSGAFALYPMTIRWAEEFKKLHPAVQIDISAGGAGKGMADVLSGMVDLAMFSREVSPEEVSKGAWYIAVTRDAVLPTTSAKNPFLKDIMAKGLTKEKFTDIFITEKIKDWGTALGIPSKVKISKYTRSDACGAAEMWGKYLGKNQENLVGIGVYGDPGIANAVKDDANGIGYNNLNFAYDIKTNKKYEGLEIIPIDLNADGKISSDENFYSSLNTVVDAIQKGVYPSPPARDLYLVSKGKPVNAIVVAFIQYILTDGQKFVTENGYVTLSADKIAAEAVKMK